MHNYLNRTPTITITKMISFVSWYFIYIGGKWLLTSMTITCMHATYCLLALLFAPCMKTIKLMQDEWEILLSSIQFLQSQTKTNSYKVYGTKVESATAQSVTHTHASL